MKLSLEQKVEINKLIKKHFEFQEECGKNGHSSKNEWFSYHSEKMNGICQSCGEMFERFPTKEEKEKYLQKIKEPYTI